MKLLPRMLLATAFAVACQHAFAANDRALAACDTGLITDLADSNGAVAPGQSIAVVGTYLDSCTASLACTVYNRIGELVDTLPATLDTDGRYICTLPDTIDCAVYGDCFNTTGCSAPEPIQSINVSLRDTSSGDLLATQIYAMLRCQARPECPATPYNASSYCYGGKCSINGRCSCPPGTCGPHCEVTTAWGGCDMPHDDLQWYQAWVLRTWSAPSSAVSARLAVGTNLSVAAYSVGYELTGVETYNGSFLWGLDELVTDDAVAAAAGSMVWNGGRTYYGNTVWGNQAGTALTMAGTSQDDPGRNLYIPGTSPAFPVDFDGSGYSAYYASARLACMPRTGSAAIQWSTLWLTGTRTDVNVFHISASDLLAVREIGLDLPLIATLDGSFPAADDADLDIPPVIINVLWDDAFTGIGPGEGDFRDESEGAGISYFERALMCPALGTAAGVARDAEVLSGIPTPAWDVEIVSKGYVGLFSLAKAAPRVIWNLPFSSKLTMERSNLVGSVLAPRADMKFASGNLQGQAWFGSMEGQGYVMNVPLDMGCNTQLLNAMYSLMEEFPRAMYLGLGGEPPATYSLALDYRTAIEHYASRTLDACNCTAMPDGITSVMVICNNATESYSVLRGVFSPDVIPKCDGLGTFIHVPTELVGRYGDPSYVPGCPSPSSMPTPSASAHPSSSSAPTASPGQGALAVTPTPTSSSPPAGNLVDDQPDLPDGTCVDGDCLDQQSSDDSLGSNATVSDSSSDNGLLVGLVVAGAVLLLAAVVGLAFRTYRAPAAISSSGASDTPVTPSSSL